MTRLPALALALFLLPASALAASAPAVFSIDRSVVVASSTSGNAYAAGGTVAVTASIPADLSALGGSLLITAPIGGDALLAGGNIDLRAPVAGDARLIGGRVAVSGAVEGDLVAVAGSFTDSGGGAKSAFIVAGTVSLERGAKGAITIYGNNVSLAGEFAGDVNVISSGRIALAASTTIAGTLTYQAPEAANIPTSAKVAGGVHYTGTSYLPTSEQARAIALAGFGVFLFVKILGALILAGLLAGLFPALSSALAKRALEGSPRRVFLTTLLGFAMLVATPVLLVLLAITFVGIGIAFVLGALYLLLILLAFAFSSVIVGSAIARALVKRGSVRWSDAVIGMLVFYIVWSVPFIGWLVASVLFAFTAGALVSFFFHVAFPHEAQSELEI